MAYNFIECNREDVYLLPPSLKEWLSEGDLVWFIMDAVEQMDLKGIYNKYRLDGRGQAAYEPSMMVSILRKIAFECPAWKGGDEKCLLL